MGGGVNLQRGPYQECNFPKIVGAVIHLLGPFFPCNSQRDNVNFLRCWGCIYNPLYIESYACGPSPPTPKFMFLLRFRPLCFWKKEKYNICGWLGGGGQVQTSCPHNLTQQATVPTPRGKKKQQPSKNFDSQQRNISHQFFYSEGRCKSSGADQPIYSKPESPWHQGWRNDFRGGGTRPFRGPMSHPPKRKKWKGSGFDRLFFEKGPIS